MLVSGWSKEGALDGERDKRGEKGGEGLPCVFFGLFVSLNGPGNT